MATNHTGLAVAEPLHAINDENAPVKATAKQTRSIQDPRSFRLSGWALSWFLKSSFEPKKLSLHLVSLQQMVLG